MDQVRVGDNVQGSMNSHGDTMNAEQQQIRIAQQQRAIEEAQQLIRIAMSANSVNSILGMNWWLKAHGWIEASKRFTGGQHDDD